MNKQVIASIFWVFIVFAFAAILVVVLVFGVVNKSTEEESMSVDPLDSISKILSDSYISTATYPTNLASVYAHPEDSSVVVDYQLRGLGYCVAATYTQGGEGSSPESSPSYYVTEERIRRIGKCPPEGVEWQKVYTGASFALAHGTDGEVYVWGDGSSGELGLGVDVKSSTEPKKIDRSEVFDGGVVTHLAAGSNHGVAVVDNKDIYTWGKGDARLGLGKQRGANVFAPAKVKPSEDMKDVTIIQVAASRLNTYVLTSGGEMFAWGSDLNGQLGTSEPSPQFETATAEPVAVEMLELEGGVKIEEIIVSPFGAHAYALDSEGTLYGWGSNVRSSLTPAVDDEVVDVPMVVFEETEFDHLRFRSVSTSATHTISLTDDGILMAWGNSAFGQYGNGTTQRQMEPMLVDMTRMSSHEVLSVKVGQHIDDRYSIAYVDGGMYVWGGNSYGLFDHDGARMRRPVFIPSVYGS